MATETTAGTTPASTLRTKPGEELLERRANRWIDRWCAQDAEFWDVIGARTAQRNLVFSIKTAGHALFAAHPARGHGQQHDHGGVWPTVHAVEPAVD
jgi:hypothetical protein